MFRKWWVRRQEKLSQDFRKRKRGAKKTRRLQGTGLQTQAIPESQMTQAGATGLEPATSGVTGRRSNQLSYAPSTRSRRHLLARRSRGGKQLPRRTYAVAE